MVLERTIKTPEMKAQTIRNPTIKTPAIPKLMNRLMEIPPTATKALRLKAKILLAKTTQPTPHQTTAEPVGTNRHQNNHHLQEMVAANQTPMAAIQITKAMAQVLVSALAIQTPIQMRPTLDLEIIQPATTPSMILRPKEKTRT